MSSNRSERTLFTLTRCGLLAAMAVILYYIEIPVVAFYKLDLSAMPAILAGFAMGPIQGIAIIVIKNLVHVMATSTMGVGELADFLMSSSFVVTASLIYRSRKTRRGALISLISGTAAIAVVGGLVNYFVMIPAYQVMMNLPLEVILGMGQAVIPSIDSALDLVLMITVPFNLLKGVVLSLVTYLLYKRVSPMLHMKSGR